MRVIDDDRRDMSVQDLNHAVIDLVVTVGLLGSVMSRFPEDVEENFIVKIENLGILIREEIAEFHVFGESLDDSVDNGD